MLQNSHARLDSPVPSVHTPQGPGRQGGVSVSCGCDLSRTCAAVPTLELAGGTPQSVPGVEGVGVRPGPR